MRRTPLRARKPYKAPRPVDPIPAHVRAYVRARDNGCVLRTILHADGFEACFGGLEIDHVRASGGLGLKSPSIPSNLVALCSAHHRFKTENGKLVRPLLLAYLEQVESAPPEEAA